jgi:hypothetical protein
MSDINLTFKHGKTHEEARTRLAMAVSEIQSRFGPALHRAEWSDNGNAVHLSGTGFEVDARVDAEEVHVKGDIPLIGRLLAGPLIANLKQIVERTFHKRLT